jgi:predicted nucleic acid-binding protein
MSTVSNASPLINLARIGKLDLLYQLYGKLIVPSAVWQKVVIEGAGQPGADDVKAATWIRTQTVTNKELVRAFAAGIGRGRSRGHCPGA